MNSWEISFSQEKDDFLVHMKVEMKKKKTVSHRKKGVSWRKETEHCLY